MINAEELKPLEPVYCFVGDDGQNVHIASVRLREWCLRVSPEVLLAPVKLEVANKFLKDGSIDIMRVFALTDAQRSEPIIFCKCGTTTSGRPDVYLVGGHHRYAWAALHRQIFIKSWLLEESQWRPFQVEGLPSVTQEELRHTPILPKNY